VDEAGEREILASALSEIGFQGAQLGAALGALFGAPEGEPSKEAVHAGVGFTARRLRLNIGLEEAAGPYPIDDLREAATEALRSTGKILQDEHNTVIGVVASGLMNMNPAVVTMRFPPSGSGHGLTIRAVALEGLIKQKAGEKAANLLQSRVTASLASSSL
jgi:hypothetical protein